MSINKESTFQSIPHTKSDKLNAYLKQDYEKALGLDYEQTINELKSANFNFDFIADTHDIVIKESHDKFVRYLRNRLSSTFSE